MQRVPLGRTGLAVTPIGYGAFKIGRNRKTKYPSQYELPDEAEAARLLHAVLDMGISYIDTAPAYGMSEERIGRHLAHRQHEFVLSTKVGETFDDGRSHYDFSADAVRRSLETSLQRLRRETLDLVFVHSDGRDVEILEQTDVVPTLEQAKRKGLVRAIGFSGKTVAGAQLALDWADVLMVEYHLHDTSHADVMAQAAAKGVGVVVKKGLASGHLPAREAIPFVLRNPHVQALVVGGLSREHLAENIALAEGVGVDRG